MIQFLQPNLLYLTIPIVFLVVFLYFKKSQVQTFGAFKDLEKIYKKNSISYKLYYIIILLIFIVGIFILARPVSTNIENKISKDGIDIMIALDVSLSMQAQDLKPTRIESAKNIIVNFLDSLVSDRVGIVVFAGKPFTSLPLNFDYQVSKKIVDNITTKILDQSVNGLSGTAIGDALVFSGNNFNQDDNRQKVLILVTDGTANIGVDPQVAAKYIKNKYKNIKIYTIGIGGSQNAYIDYLHPLGFTQKLAVEGVDDESLKEIAEIGGGRYFRAENNDSLDSIFNEISQLESSKLEVQNFESRESLGKYFVYLLSFLLLIFLGIRIRKNI